MWEIDHCIFKGSFGAPLGILPDQMHLVHLAIAPDAIVSSLLDWTDSEEYVSGSTREKRLAELWDHYRCFCEEAHIGDRASRKLFSVATLSPDSIGYIEVSQKNFLQPLPGICCTGCPVLRKTMLRHMQRMPTCILIPQFILYFINSSMFFSFRWGFETLKHIHIYI